MGSLAGRKREEEKRGDMRRAMDEEAGRGGCYVDEVAT